MTAHDLIAPSDLPAAFAAVLGLNGLLIAAVAASKVLRERREAYVQRVRQDVMEALLPLLETGAGTTALPPPATLAGDAALETAVSLIAAVKGEARTALVALLETRGYVSGLLRALRSRNASRRARAAMLLGGSRSHQAVPALAAVLEHDPAPGVRMIAAEALGGIGDPPTVLLLLRALGDPVRYQQLRISGVLSAMGALAVPALEERLDGPNASMIARVLDILIDVGMLSNSGRVERLLQHPSPEVRGRAAALLGAAGAVDSVPALVFASRDPWWFVRLRIVKALAALGVPDREPVRGDYFSALEHLVYDDRWAVRRNAAAALAASGDDGAAILRAIGSDVARAALASQELHRGRAVSTVF